MSRIHNTCCTPQLLSNTRIAQRYPTSSQQTTLKACMVKNHFHDTSIPAWEQLRCTFRRISRLLLPVQRAESKTIDNHSTYWSYKLKGRHSVTHTGRNLSQYPMTLSKKVKAGQPSIKPPSVDRFTIHKLHLQPVWDSLRLTNHMHATGNCIIPPVSPTPPPLLLLQGALEHCHWQASLASCVACLHFSSCSMIRMFWVTSLPLLFHQDVKSTFLF